MKSTDEEETQHEQGQHTMHHRTFINVFIYLFPLRKERKRIQIGGLQSKSGTTLASTDRKETQLANTDEEEEQPARTDEEELANKDDEEQQPPITDEKYRRRVNT